MQLNPCPNTPYKWYIDSLYQNCIICEKLHFDLIETGVTLKKELSIKIPNDYEIKKIHFMIFIGIMNKMNSKKMDF